MICLSMMVKNEQDTIARAIRSVKPFIDCWCIVDTGSTDNTEAVIRKELEGVPGVLYSRPWVNWGHNRTEAITLAKGYADFVFIMDADEEFITPKDYKLPELSADTAYYVAIDFGGLLYRRPNLISVMQDWKYIGVTHEYLTTSTEVKKASLNAYLKTAPERTGKTKERCQEDANLLLNALKEEPNNARYVFYLAQSYRDCEKNELAIAAYRKRISMGGWDEEVWYAHYQVARLMAAHHPQADVIAAFLAAYNYRPSRAESLAALAQYCRVRGMYAAATLFAEKAMSISLPTDLLFIETNWYRWQALDEFAISSYYVGRFKDSYDAGKLLLNIAPVEHTKRVLKNMQYAMDKLEDSGGR